MRRKAIILAVLLMALFAWFPGVQQTALAAEKTVGFTIPWCNT